MWWILYEILFSTIFLFSLALTIVYYYGKRTYDYWKNRGIPYLKPKYPYFGNSFETSFSLKNVHIKQLEMYKYFHGKRFGGIFSFTHPVLFVRDPSLIESIMVKDFTSFYNRGTGVDPELDPLSAHLVNLEDQQWKSLRQKLTPTFSSGKLKGMHQQLVDCSDALVKYIERFADSAEPIEVREIMAKFSTDVIGSCAFGLNMNAMNDPDSEFRNIGRKVFQPSFKGKLRRAIRSNYPKLLKLLKWKALDETTENFFISTLKSTMSYRENNNVTRNDFVQLLMELKKHEDQKQSNAEEHDGIIIDDKVITANAFAFFAAGFETTASTLSYCLYELSLHQDIQEEAYKHVVSVLNKHGGEISYDAVNEMSLINQIFAETLRMHPPVPELRRIATKDYLVPESKLVLPKGFSVLIPVYSLHYDSEHFPEPEKFKPERFTKEKNAIKKGTYLPFGDGPRICIGKRFAKMEMQVALVKLLLKYKFTLNSKTISPLVYNSSSILMVPIGGIWIDLHRRCD
ncbi:hypothetical protein O3M35_002871 [Rhynocoris fuscipes]|uniref:Cytochrome P450 n=1 Tax=Rhynocoris fuscipes TaxID=488301 RepID=A0AAW1CN73_9HEMI